ncbi:hypothetical protein N7468_009501 [Penicillium chermesinum]|uniref:Uncharacterized protein n=1 Tax=Penicillium chermesinum TaxID=63820 RepID=A0A9W9NI42_9EURO|nr:uncharacterized protein N7468_009501 [Penicillium chermesinum]KAJ5220297.1 hypothetical protein N7468_009501 [Penicillium chermesinum]
MCPAPTKQKYAFGVQEMVIPSRQVYSVPRLERPSGALRCLLELRHVVYISHVLTLADAREDGGESLSVISSSSSKDGDGDVKCLGKLEAILEYVHFTEDGDNVGGGLRDKDDV